MKFHIKLAGLIIEINSKYREAFDLCRDYTVKAEGSAPDITICSKRRDISFERKKSYKEDKKEGRRKTRYKSSYLEVLSIYRKIAAAMPDYGAFLIHGSVVAVGDCAYMITAKSGVGKTTRTMRWLEEIPGSYIVNGDKPLIKIEKDRVLACGTPWCGKEKMNRNVNVPLKAIFLLERAQQGQGTTVEETGFFDAFPMLYQQTFVPSDKQAAKRTLDLLGQLNSRVRLFRFRSSLSDDTVKMAYRAASSVDKA